MEKTLTFTVEDALLSPVGMAILTGAGLVKPKEADKKADINFHMTTTTTVGDTEIDLTDALEADEKISSTAPIFAMIAEDDGSITGDVLTDVSVSEDGKKLTGNFSTYATKMVVVDYYVLKKAHTTSEIQIDADKFAGYFYVEASTLVRRQSDGVDLPANITIPNVKIQTSFSFAMSSTGDPSTFTFTMDAFPGYTYFNATKKVLCVIQIVDDKTEDDTEATTVMSGATAVAADEEDDS